MSSQKDYLREEAAQRAADIEAQRNAAAAVERARRERQSKKDLERKEALDALSSSQGAGSAHFARVAASDYTHNSARTMVAADGTQSRSREWLGLGARWRDYGQTALVTTIATSLPHEHIAFERFTADGPIALLPLPDARDQPAQTRRSLVWALETEAAQRVLALSDAVQA